MYYILICYRRLQVENILWHMLYVILKYVENVCMYIEVEEDV